MNDHSSFRVMLCTSMVHIYEAGAPQARSASGALTKLRSCHRLCGTQSDRSCCVPTFSASPPAGLQRKTELAWECTANQSRDGIMQDGV